MAFTALEDRFVRGALDAYLERNRPPPEIRPELDLGCRIDGQSVEIFEIRPRWRGAPGEVQELPVAKATYVRRHDHWRIYWMRRDLKWHRYDPDATVATIGDVLAIVERDEYACFFG